MRKERIAIVIPRFGAEVNGGAEQHARRIAMLLAKQYDITVLTTTARDLAPWENWYAQGTVKEGDITIARFPVEDRVPEGLAQRYKDFQGPYAPSLIAYIQASKNEFLVFFFISYMFYTTVAGMPEVAEKAAFMPLAHDEEIIYNDYFYPLFHLPQYFLFNSAVEARLVHRVFKNRNIPYGVVGEGVDTPDKLFPTDFILKYDADNYILYVGRIESSKGCDGLIRYFGEYKKAYPSNLKLVMIGRNTQRMPKVDDVVFTGFLTDQEKFDAMKGARALVMPSRHESLCMAVLEALSVETPVLVNAHCAVTRNHCIQGNCGLYYYNYKQFEGCLHYLLDNEDVRGTLGRNGKQYVETHYSWDATQHYIDEIMSSFRGLCGTARPTIPVVHEIEDENKNRIFCAAIFGHSDKLDSLIQDLIKQRIFQLFRYLIVTQKEKNKLGRLYHGLFVCTIENTPSYIDYIWLADPIYHAAHALSIKNTFSSDVKLISPFSNRAVFATKEIVVNRYQKRDALSEEAWNSERIRTQSKNMQAIDAYVDEAMRHVPLFSRVEIETINRCNGECTFCPVNRHVEKRDFKMMEESLFQKIVAELHDMDYDGSLALYSNNEPLMDKRNVEFNEYLRQQVPKARIYMHTNGTLLTRDKLIRLANTLDDLVIDNYNQALELNPTSQMVLDYYNENPGISDRVTIVMRKPDEVLTTRGSAAPNRQERVSYEKRRCSLPFRQMIIRPDGKLSLCCNDALGVNTLGDLKIESMTEAWYGKRYAKMRELIYRGRENIAICKYCDEFHITGM